jgi:CheY-like chemotaxis protein
MLKDRCILVVDPHQDTQFLYETVFQAEQATVVTVSSVMQALQWLECHKPDLIVSEIVLPGVDGLSLIRRLRNSSMRSYRRIPAVAVTGFASEMVQKQAQEAGFQRCLWKPVDMNSLTQVLADVLAGKVTTFGLTSEAC